MGLHTGEPKVGEERYVGIGVHRAARIGAAGHGGQVLLSSTTKELAEEELPPGVTIRDLGERRLKDMDQPQRLYQLVIEGLQSDFAQLNTLDVELRRKRRRMYAGSALIGVVAAAVAIPVFALGQGGGGGGLTVEGNAVAEIDPGSNTVVGQVPNVGARPGRSLSARARSGWPTLTTRPSRVWIPRHARPRALHREMPERTCRPTDAVWAVSSTPAQPFGVLTRIDPRFDVVTKRIRIGDRRCPDRRHRSRRGWAHDWGRSTGVIPRGTRSRRPGTGNSPGASPRGVRGGGLGHRPRCQHRHPSGSRHEPARRPFRWGSARARSRSVRAPFGSPTGRRRRRPDRPGHERRDDHDRRRPFSDRHRRRRRRGLGGQQRRRHRHAHRSRLGQAVEDDRRGRKPAGDRGRGRSGLGDRAADRPGLRRAGPRRGGSRQLGERVDSLDPALGLQPVSRGARCTPPAPSCSTTRTSLRPQARSSSRRSPGRCPTRSADGKTYTFTIRTGFRFSPPSNEPVTAQTFRYTIERSLSPRMKSSAQGYLGDIVGAKAYEAGKARAHLGRRRREGTG